MASDSVRLLTGVGSKTETILTEHKITTVGELANATPGQIPISNLPTLIERAKVYLQRKQTPQQTPQQTTLQPLREESKKKEDNKPTTITIPTLATGTPQESLPQHEEDYYLLKGHSWWEYRVIVPHEGSLREAYVYELSIEPGDRIAFICSWVEAPENEDLLCQMTYSPQLLFHFNTVLPPLEVNIQEVDVEKLPNRFVLENVLKEVNMMQKCVAEMNF